LRNCASITFWFTALSSATRIRAPFEGASGAAGATGSNTVFGAAFDTARQARSHLLLLYGLREAEGDARCGQVLIDVRAERRHHDQADRADRRVGPDGVREGEKRQRAEDVKVRLDTAARQVNEQRRRQHLADRDGVAGQALAWSQDGEGNRERADRAAQEDRRPYVQMYVARRADPRARRHPVRDGDAEDPLDSHQHGKQTIGLQEDPVLQLGEDFVSTALGTKQHGEVDRYWVGAWLM
jgi:hypothetical protein